MKYLGICTFVLFLGLLAIGCGNDNDAGADADTDSDTDTDTDTDIDTDTDSDTDPGWINTDIFVAKYNEDGTLAWVSSAGGDYPDVGTGIASLSDGSSIITGNFFNEATFGAGEANETVLIAEESDGELRGGAFVAKYNSDGTLAWATSAGGSSEGIATLSDGSSLITGWFDATAMFGAEVANETIMEEYFNQDIFIAKYNADGTLGWVKSAGGDSYDGGRGIASLSDGSSIVTGYFYHEATFGAGEVNETVLVSVSHNDEIFIAKYNADGTLAWAKSATGHYEDVGSGIVSLPDGSSLITGWFGEEATFGMGEANETILIAPPSTSYEIFIAKYNSDGTLAWAKGAGGYGPDRGRGIAALSDGSALITGDFYDATVFGVEETNETALKANGHFDIFQAKYNGDGNIEWAKKAGGYSYDGGYSIATSSDGSSLITGYFQETAVFGAGEANETVLTGSYTDKSDKDIFIAKYNVDGTLAWAKSAGGISYDGALGITTLSDGSTVITGHHGSKATFGTGENNETTLE